MNRSPELSARGKPCNSDERANAAAAYALFVVVLLQPWRKRTWEAVLLSTATALMFVALPYLDLVAYIGWTDPIALPFLVVAIRYWNRGPVMAAVALGLALSTKQYFIVVAPVLLLVNDSRRWQRVIIAGATVLATYLPFLSLGTSVIFNPLEQIGGQTYRPDSLGLPNLKVNVPRLISMIAGFIVAGLAGFRGGSAARIALGMCAALSVLFVTGSQLFINYWVVVAGLIVVALEAHGSGSVAEADGSSASIAHAESV